MASLARKYLEQSSSLPQPKTKPERRTRTVTRHSKKSYFTVKEYFIISVFVFIIGALGVNVIATQANAFSYNRENVSLQQQIDLKKKTISDLNDRVVELSMPDRIRSIAEQQGLTLNEQNVKVVNDK